MLILFFGGGGSGVVSTPTSMERVYKILPEVRVFKAQYDGRKFKPLPETRNRMV